MTNAVSTSADKQRGPRTTRHKGITRIDRPEKRTHGYQVRVFWRKQRHQSFFSDATYGDRLAALDAALRWRDETEERIGKPRTERMVYGDAQGVHQRGDVFEATWVMYDEEGRPRQRRTNYSIAKHGAAKARRLARNARKRGEQQRYEVPR